jgi:phage gp46-like protein
MAEGDFKMFIDENGFDIKVEGGEPKMTGGLTTEILIYLFCKLKKDGSINYWYDSISNDLSLTGSTFYTVFNEPNTEENRNKIPGKVSRALKPMIDAGKIERVETIFETVNPEFIIIQISIFEPEETSLRFKLNWDQQKIELL